MVTPLSQEISRKVTRPMVFNMLTIYRVVDVGVEMAWINMHNKRIDQT
uniref:Uncharacterized protein n=1 Tax=Rhizophora mucronata TaxID=61149 RepID=A0A2P2QR04_RHIMU